MMKKHMEILSGKKDGLDYNGTFEYTSPEEIKDVKLVSPMKTTDFW
jgi:hypothetical protein